MTPPPSRRVIVATLVLHFVGIALALVFLATSLPIPLLLAAAAIATVPFGFLRWARHDDRWRRGVGWAAWLAVAITHAFVLYLAVGWAWMLGWTVPAWAWSLVALAFGAAIWTLRPSHRGPRLPLVVPLGLVITFAVRGWPLEETRVRCDDYLAVRAHPDTEILVTSTPSLARCSEGETLPLGRYPRIVWEPPSGDRLLVTTQSADGATSPETSRFAGSLCEVRPDDAPECVGEGKAQGLAESAALDRVYVASWGRFEGGHRGELLVVPREGPFELVARVPVEGSIGEVFVDDEADRVYGFTDEGGEVVQIGATTFERAPTLAASFLVPGAVRYDAARGEGILCAAGGPVLTLDGRRFMSIAVRGRPYAARPLGDFPLSWLTLTWGCDWDPARRRAWIAVPNLGLISTVDYDTGEVLGSRFVGFGVRSVTFDPDRRRLYVTEFLRGQVLALDADTSETLERWRVGRFPRMVTISRDGSRLFVGTNVGLVAIQLDGSAR